MLLGHVDQRAKQIADAGVIHEDIDPPKCCDGKVHQGRDIFFDQHVSGKACSLTSARNNFIDDLVEFSFLTDAVRRRDIALNYADVMHNHLGTIGGQSFGHSLSQAFVTARAGHNCDFTLQPRHHSSALLFAQLRIRLWGRPNQP